MSQLYLARGHFDKALEAASEAAAIAGESKDRLYEGTAQMHMGYAEFGLMDLDAAAAHFTAAHEIFQAIQDRMRTLSAEVELARVAFEQGEPNILTAVPGLVERARDQDFQLVEIDALELLGDIAIRSGNADLGIQHYGEALALLEPLSWDSKETEISVKIAEVHLGRGSLEAAEPFVGLVSQRQDTLPGLRLRAHFAAAKGDFTLAAEMMQKARDLQDGRWAESDERDLAVYLAEAG